ncbi:MAG: M20 family metallopeptidase [Bacteroidales bacterium]
MDLADKIKEKAGLYFNEIREIRRHIHMHPELSFAEFETSRFISGKLRKFGIDFNSVAGTGIIARITGEKKKSSHSVALRAELDALPVQEETGLPFMSCKPGIMHACGHDVHAACLLGSGRIIKEMEKEFSGTVYLVFQPGEESLPGGAKKMLEEDLFKGREPDLILAQHVLPELDTGVAGVKSGLYMASGDEIYINISGEGGHGAMPHMLVDTVVAASQVVVALQQISSRLAPPGIPTVLSFGKMIANGATNVIPKEAILEGTFRTMDESWRAKAHEKITSVATNTAHNLGAKCSVEIRKGYPVLINDPVKTSLVKQLMTEYLGEKNVKELPVRMTTEDFAWFAGSFPSVFYRLGTGRPGNLLHTPGFDIDEKSIITGSGLPAWLALSFLNNI